MSTTIEHPDERALTCRPLAGFIGARIDDFDLSQPMDGPMVERVLDALAEHGVLIFPKQDITPEDHRRFAEALGPPRVSRKVQERLPDPGLENVGVISTKNGIAYNTDHWHSDGTWDPNPPGFTVIHMQQIPPAGGDTMWSSQIAAYETLSDPIKALLAPLTALHGLPSKHLLPAGEPQTATHPVVCVHPRSGRLSLFVNEYFTKQVLELSELESDRILHMLYEHANRNELTCRWHWSVGDVAVWDNHFVQHYAIHDYGDNDRKIHRIEIDAPPPVAPARSGSAGDRT